MDDPTAHSHVGPPDLVGPPGHVGPPGLIDGGPSRTEHEHRRPVRTLPRWLVILGALVLLASIGGVAAWGYASIQELERQKSALASANQDLAASQSELAGVNGSLAAVRQTHSEATSTSASLTERVANQSACIDAQATAREAISSITDLQIDTFNLTTKNSVWAKAEIAREKALLRAADDYYAAYKSAFLGNTSAAAASYRKGQAEVATADAQLKIQNGELATVSANNKLIMVALDAFGAKLAKATTACAVK
jgi:hypothetical protein